MELPVSEPVSMHKIVLVRHGECESKNTFYGWYDTKLSEKGIIQAIDAGKTLKVAALTFDVAHTSLLTRAQKTLQYILKEIDQLDLPIEKSWKLNDRHFGGLTGLNKTVAAAKYGEEQLDVWLYNPDLPPPLIKINHMYYDQILNDPRYKNDLKKEEFPMSETLELTFERTLAYWNDVIIPQLKENKTILVVAHDNNLRGIVQNLDNLSDTDTIKQNLPFGIPFVYEFDNNFKQTGPMKFLGDEKIVDMALKTSDTEYCTSLNTRTRDFKMPSYIYEFYERDGSLK